MAEMKELTREELEMRMRRLQAEYETSMKIADRLALSLARKEVEIARLNVQLDEVSQGYKLLEEKLNADHQSKAKDTE